MTDFLTELETQLRAAHPRRRAARRKAVVGRAVRGAPAALVLATVIAGGATFVVVTDGPEGIGAPAPAADAPVAAVLPGPGDVGEVVVLNGTPRPGLARGVGDVVALRARVVGVGNAADPGVEDTVVVHAGGARGRGQRLANWLGVAARRRTDAERLAMDGAAVGVVVGLDTVGAGTTALVDSEGDRVGTAAQIFTDGRRFLALRADLPGRVKSVQLGDARPLGQLRPAPDGSGAVEIAVHGIADTRSRALRVREGRRVVARATLPPRIFPTALVPGRVSILSAEAGDRASRIAARLVEPVAPVARLAPDEPPARTTVYFAPGGEVLAGRIAERVGATPRPFPDALTRARAGDEVVVAVALGRDFVTSRGAPARGGGRVEVIRFTDRAVVTVDVPAERGTRGDVVTVKGRVAVGPAAGGRLRASVSVPGLGSGDARVSVDGREVAVVPVG